MPIKLPWSFPCMLGLVLACDTSSHGVDNRVDAASGGSVDATSEANALEIDAPLEADAAPSPVSTDAAADVSVPVADARVTLDGDAGSQPFDASEAPDVLEQPPLASPGCLAGITRYKERGSFSFALESVGAVKLWVPAVPQGCKVPVVHFAGGTGAGCESYKQVLEHLASHGFLVTCYESAGTGPSAQCISALETAYAKHPELADAKIGSSGHEVGGEAAFLCVQHAEEKWGHGKLYAGHAAEPVVGSGSHGANFREALAGVTSPLFLFNGSADMLVPKSWVEQSFEVLSDTTEAYWYEGQGATHLPIPSSFIQESALVFFRWKLLGDKQACETFKAMPLGPDWKLMRKQAEQGC